jgi:hypothetical protein
LAQARRRDARRKRTTAERALAGAFSILHSQRTRRAHLRGLIEAAIERDIEALRLLSRGPDEAPGLVNLRVAELTTIVAVLIDALDDLDSAYFDLEDGHDAETRTLSSPSQWRLTFGALTQSEILRRVLAR